MTAEYAAALAILPYEDLHSNSFVDVCYQLTTHAYGYVTGEFCHHSLVSAPLLAGADPGGMVAAQHQPILAFLQEYLTNHHDLCQSYVPLRFRAAPRPLALPPAAWQHIIERQKQRDPVEAHNDEAQPQISGLDVHVNTAVLPTRLSASVGTLEDAATRNNSHAVSGAKDLLYGTMEADVMGRKEAIENLLFTAFFPSGDGVFQKLGARSLSPDDYLKHRCRQAFTPFCKQTPYLLLLRSIANMRRCLADSKGAHIVNEKAYLRAKEAAEAAGEAVTNHDLLKTLLKQKVSSKVEGSPASFRRSKQDLDAMVREIGLPHFFCTVTMHETGEDRAPEYACIDAIMKEWNPSFTWQVRLRLPIHAVDFTDGYFMQHALL